jgi:hypothetical protein
MVKKIRTERKGKPRVRGHRATARADAMKRSGDRNADAFKKALAQRIVQEQTRRRRMTRKDEATGESYVLAQLALKDKADVEAYREGLADAVSEAQDADTQAEAIRSYLQAQVDAKRLVPIPCNPGERPTCKAYTGEGGRIVAMRQDDPEAGVMDPEGNVTKPEGEVLH